MGNPRLLEKNVLKIRKEQIMVFRAYMRKKFVDRMLVILPEYYPEDCAVLGEVQTRKVIELGIARAETHGFETQGPVCDYICLMFTFGSYFDADPLLPWAAAVLENREGIDAATLIKNLYAKAADYSRRVAGDDGEYHTRALLRARQKPFDALNKINSGDLIQDVRSLLNDLYSQRYQILTESSLKWLVDLGQTSAGKYGAGTQEGILVYVGLMFMLSSHFDRDPLHPWAAAVLQDSAITEPGLKARKLHEAAMTRLDQALEVNGTIEKE